jgi:biotin operon repressor
MKGETAVQKTVAAARYFAWCEFIVDDWQPVIAPGQRIKSSTAKLVALAKATKTDYGRSIFRSDQYVADATGLDRMTVQRHMKFLEDAGIFRPTNRRHGRSREMIIAIPDPALLPEAAIETDAGNDRMMPGQQSNAASGSIDSDASGSTNLSMNLSVESLCSHEVDPWASEMPRCYKCGADLAGLVSRS